MGTNNKLEWITEKRKVNDLLPMEVNPRKISEENKQKLISSIEKFNLAEIPAINNDNTIIAGHQRIKALQLIGRGDELIDVRIPNRKLTNKEIKEYMLISNSHSGEWDFDLLDLHFSEINMGEVGLDLKKIEFQNSDVFDKNMNNFFKSKEVTKLEAIEDNYEVPDEIKTNIVRGDLLEFVGGGLRTVCFVAIALTRMMLLN